jgi:predicted PurR-regulated permease PerM
LLLSLTVATMFWTNGDGLVAVLHDALRRPGGPIAEQAIDVAAGAIRGVAYGVICTAAIQAILLAIAGVPGAGTLGFVALLRSSPSWWHRHAFVRRSVARVQLTRSREA